MTSPNIHPESGGYTPEELSGANVVDAEGNKVGAVQKVYRDDTTGEPEWVTVRTGLFGTKETFVPLAGATRTDNGVRVPHAKDVIKDAPRIDVDGHLDRSEEGALYQHYGMSGPGDTGRGMADRNATGRYAAGVADVAGSGGAASAGMADTGKMAAAGGAAGAAGVAGGLAASGAAAKSSATSSADAGTGARTLAGAGAPSRGAADLDAGRSAPGTTGTKGQFEEMVISEERLNVSKEEHESGRAQLRKRVVTEDVTKSVEVSHEEVRVSRVPITDEERRVNRTGANIADGQVEVVLHEERAVMSKETVPVERVRIEVYKVTEQQELSGQVRKEQFEFDEGVRAKYADDGGTRSKHSEDGDGLGGGRHSKR
ncbi:DUF2382 domain-containing protein [Streptomyces sp. NPDC051561]|uniref:DUF2382 domain-containing protein n=1 Tax=Streptomyces sp. NPDC051561 TaxID=3365658 RepID=UPI0037B6605C